jgi:hypothetical protein
MDTRYRFIGSEFYLFQNEEDLEILEFRKENRVTKWANIPSPELAKNVCLLSITKALQNSNKFYVNKYKIVYNVYMLESNNRGLILAKSKR